MYEFLIKLRNRHFAILDVFLLLLSPTIALGLRVNLPWSEEYNFPLVIYTILALLIKIAFLLLFRLYSRYWRYASVDEMMSITYALTLATIFNIGSSWGLQGIQFFGPLALPRSIPFLDGLISLLFIGGTRFSIRIAEYWKYRTPKPHKGKRVLIVGAGDAGQMVAREIINSQLVNLNPIGFADDDQDKIGSVIHGLPVLGAIDTITKIIEKNQVEEVIIAIPTAAGNVIRNVISQCKALNIPTKMIPGIYEILNGKISVSRLRKVEIDDLLRRSIAEIDTIHVGNMISGKRILITGAGGSIGAEICRQIIPFQPSQLILLGHGENSLFNLEWQIIKLKKEAQNELFPDFEIVLGDIRDKNRLNTIFNKYLPQVVFHTAAHKHVPLMEINPEEAVTNNLLGTMNLVDISIKSAIERFVFISTDKAVNPTNIMGMTKRIAERMIYDAAQKTKLPYVTVRFGNVLGSRGSVVPLFQEQISKGGPVTVTHPDVSRYFMTVTEAAILVLQAAAMGEGGEIFVLDMGEPIKIVDLVRDMIELSGFEVGKDIEIVFTGLRPGERLQEDLLIVGEKSEKTDHEKIFVVRNQKVNIKLNFQNSVNELIKTAQLGMENEVTEKLRFITEQLIVSEVDNEDSVL